MSGGVFAIARSIWTDPDFADEPFTERQAFMWLVSEAAWRDHKTRGARGPILLRRGEFCCSVRFMADACGWSKSRAGRFLTKILKRGILRDTSRNGEKVYFLNNYNKFQKIGLPKDSPERDTSGTRAGHERDKLETGETGEYPPNSPPDDFDRFWEAFDHKKARRSAERAWAASLKRGNDPEELISAAADYRRSKPDKQFMKHPATWLNADCQNDEIETTKPEPRNEHSAKPHSTILAGFGEALRRTGSVALRDTDAPGGGRSGAVGNALGRGAGEGTPRQIEAPRGGQRSEGAGYGRAHGGVPRSAD